MDRVSAWLLGKLDDLRPGDGKPNLDLATELGRVVEVLHNRSGMVFGMVVGAIDRDVVLGRGAKVITEWLPYLPLTHLNYYADVARHTSLPIDTAPFLANAQRIDAEITAAAAAKEAERLAAFAEKRAAAASKEPRNAALEAALGDGEAAEPFSVYADWLEAHGAIRGELVHRMLAAEPSANAGADAEIDAFIAEHADELIGMVPSDNNGEELADDAYTLVWRRGFIDTLDLSSTDGITAALEHFLEHPSGRRVRVIAIGMNGEPDPDEPHGEVVSSIIREKPQHLVALHLGAFDPDRCDISSYAVGDISAIWRGLPTLRKVTLTGGSFELGTIEAPQLEVLELRTGGLTAANIQSIASADWPNLRELDVYFGDHNYGGDTELTDVVALLSNEYPVLVHLGLKNCPFVDDAVSLLVEAPVAAQLESLDLSLGCLGDAGVDELVANKSRLVNLKRVNVSVSYLSPVGLQALSRLGVEIIAEHMNDPAEPDDRFVLVSE
ncbi:MAG TPA: hypothetical protein VGC41_07465 [Kofleriaceae bacterium]